jgi:RNA polymerase sigma factor for flagellar operon FliA
LAHVRLVHPIAKKVLAGLPAHVELSDLVQDGMCGLIGAARRYKSRRGVPFPLYAKHRIRGAILDGLRRVDPATRDSRSKVKKFEAAARELGDELGRTPTTAEVAAKAGTTAPRWLLDPLGWRSGPALRGRTEERSTDSRDLRAGEAWRPDVRAGHQELRAVLFAAMESLPLRYRQIMLLYHWKGVTMREIGRAFGVNESRVSQIHKRALELMAGCLKSSGITSSASVLG